MPALRWTEEALAWLEDFLEYIAAEDRPAAARRRHGYRVTVANAGPDAAAAVTLTDVLLATVGYQGAAGSGWSCGKSGGTVTCTRTALAAGTSAQVAIAVTAPAATGRVVNQATVGAATADPDAADNAARRATPVLPPGTVPAIMSIIGTML